MAERFGMVFCVQVGWSNFVVLNGYKVIKETLGQKAEEFSDRAPAPLLCLIGRARNSAGIVAAMYSDGWKQQRRFCISTLKSFGMGKKTFEKRVSEEAGYLCSEFRSKEGSPFNPQYILINAVSNIICIITFGNRFEYNDAVFLKLMHLTEELIKTLSRILPQILAAGSWLSYIPGPHLKARKLYKELSVMLREIVSEHKKTRDPTFSRNVIDAFLEEIEKAKGNPESSFNEQNLINVIFDLFAAGTETTASTVLWGLLNLVCHPEVQKRVQEEIDKVIGRAKPPMMDDQQKLPYTTAVIHEIQRFADILPITFPYITHQDIEVGKFVIPKETIVFSHLSSVLRDESMWEKPHQFYPEHFLDANGQFVKREAFLPFGAGRHACPGEQLVKMELFIFFTTLLQHFTFHIPENSPRPKGDRVFALTVFPSPFEICAIPR
ncbi:cytochrome P450 2D17-like isoform X2 [Hemicordylus capensis]|nr:cytochrome P450 2D17-like isoform X2 [Hemicordylus capensis]